jgi:hypothetical protein
MKLKSTIIAMAATTLLNAQNVMTPEKLWTLNKFSVSVVSPDQASILYQIGTVDLKTEKTKKKNYFLNVVDNSIKNIDFGKKSILQWDKNGIYAQENDKIFLSKDNGNSWTEFYTIG